MSKPGLYANIHAKKARIKAGSGETMRKVPLLKKLLSIVQKLLRKNNAFSIRKTT
jgi:hypothetical protein